ncbi:MAG: peptidoglycan DD-metalloendopeptidase family protein [Ignavibacteriales bacterium]|nr:peptidoglycan DD-metalloendopeptidase family protein [Ignavibacteriales bacterium]
MKIINLGIVKIILFFFIVFLISLFLSFILILYTPMNELVINVGNSQLRKQVEKIENLEERINILMTELKSISSNNKNLKYTYVISKSDTTIDSIEVIYDSLKSEPVNPFEGNIFSIYNKWIESKNSNLDSIKIFFIRPCEGIVIREFSSQIGHMGIDFGCKQNTPILASAGGLIIFSDYTVKDGNVIMIEHDNDYLTVYKHLSTLTKKSREYVHQSEVLGFSGNTGTNTTGPHLHFEIWEKGKPINPRNILINLGE